MPNPEVKIGDKLVHSRGNHYSLDEVVGITPTGRIKLKSGCVLRTDLSLIGGGEWPQDLWSIPTKKSLERVRRYRLIENIERFKRNKLSDSSTETLEAIWEICKNA